MMVYHFLNQEHAFENIKNQRLKIATIMELNDPFEGLCVDMSDKKLRRRLNQTKKALSKEMGLLCFSKSWSNPVQWSHYADCHKGACLGFEIPDNKLKKIIYSSIKMRQLANEIDTPNAITEKRMRKALSIKYAHWQYEDEMRWFVSLEERTKSKGLYFKDFNSELILKKVIIGARSEIRKSDLADALGEGNRNVEIFKARTAFKTFRIVPQLNWKG